MRNAWLAVILTSMALGLVACAGEDPDVRRGDTFYKNRQWDAAFQAYERAVEKDPANLEKVRENMKNAYYYHGGQYEMNDSLDAAVRYYELGFALLPTDMGICNKLANYFWEREEFEKSANYFARLVELDGEAPDTEEKWRIMGQDYYALGYALYETGKIDEAIEAFEQSLKVAPKGAFAKKTKSALEAARQKQKK